MVMESADGRLSDQYIVRSNCHRVYGSWIFEEIWRLDAPALFFDRLWEKRKTGCREEEDCFIQMITLRHLS